MQPMHAIRQVHYRVSDARVIGFEDRAIYVWSGGHGVEIMSATGEEYLSITGHYNVGSFERNHAKPEVVAESMRERGADVVFREMSGDD